MKRLHIEYSWKIRKSGLKASSIYWVLKNVSWDRTILEAGDAKQLVDIVKGRSQKEMIFLPYWAR